MVKSANSLAVTVEGTVIVVIGWAVETGVLVEGTGRGVRKKKEGDNLCTSVLGLHFPRRVAGRARLKS